jgi:hypothetical protein
MDRFLLVKHQENLRWSQYIPNDQQVHGYFSLHNPSITLVPTNNKDQILGDPNVEDYSCKNTLQIG